MARLYYNHLYSFLNTAIDADDTTIFMADPFQEGGVDIPTITLGEDIMAISVDEEVMHVTAYVSGSASATVLRGQEGTVANSHNNGARVYNTATKADIGSPGAVEPMTIIVASHNAPLDWVAAATYICDGVDDQDQINDAIQDIGNGWDSSGRVLLSPGTFILGDSIDAYNWASYVRLEGATGQHVHPYQGGYSTDIRAGIATAVDYPLIRASYQFHMKRIQLHDWYNSTATVATHIDASSCTVLTLEECSVRQGASGSVAPSIYYEGYALTVRDSYLQSRSRPALVCADNGYIIGEISGCYFYGATGESDAAHPGFIVIEGNNPAATTFEGDDHFFSIHHNMSDGNSQTLIRLQRSVSHIRIHDNVFPYDNYGDYNQIECVLSENIDIHDNYLTAGVMLEDSRDIRVGSNHLQAVGKHSIELIDSYDCLIDGNILIDSGATAGTADFIRLSGTSSDNVIEGNVMRVRDEAAPANAIHIVDITCQDNMLRNNSCGSEDELPVTDNGTETDTGFVGSTMWYDSGGASVRHATRSRSVEAFSGDYVGEYAAAVLYAQRTGGWSGFETWRGHGTLAGYAAAGAWAARAGTDADDSLSLLQLEAENDDGTRAGYHEAGVRLALQRAFSLLRYGDGVDEVTSTTYVDLDGLHLNSEGADMGLNGATPVPRATITGSRSADLEQIVTDLLAFLHARGDIIDSTTA